jgi:hypothetical protein
LLDDCSVGWKTHLFESLSDHSQIILSQTPEEMGFCQEENSIFGINHDFILA